MFVYELLLKKIDIHFFSLAFAHTQKKKLKLKKKKKTLIICSQIHVLSKSEYSRVIYVYNIFTINHRSQAVIDG